MALDLISILITALIIIVIKYCYDFYKYWKYFQVLPGERSFHPILGNMHLIPGPSEEGMAYELTCVKRFKSFHRAWAGSVVPVILCYSPSTVKAVLKSSAPKPVGGRYISSPYDMGFRWLGDGLLLSNGAKWSRNRRLLTPAFHFDILKPYINVYNECARLLLKKFDSFKDESFDVFQPVINCTLDVILRTAFSYNSDCQTISEQNDYVKNLTEIIYLWVTRTYKPQIHPEWIYGLTAQGKRFYKLCDDVHKFADEIIEKRSEELKKAHANGFKNTSKVTDFLDTLLMAQDENGEGLTHLEIRNECDTFLFEGHDTTSSGTAWTMYCLAKHPEYQERVYDEVIKVLDGREELEWADMSNLEYTTMCIKESMRLFSVVPFIERRVNEPLNFDGHIIPAGTLVAVHIWNLHHNPYVWENPDVYDPERFSVENHAKMDPFQYIPFSAGTRNCIGQHFALNEMRVLVSSVIKNYKLETDTKELPRRFLSVTIKTVHGAKIFATRRQ